MRPARHTTHLQTRVRKILELLLFVLLFANSSHSVSAQSDSARDNQKPKVDAFIREHNEKRMQNPEGLSFTIRLKDNRKQFHLGEVITLELSFASSKPATFTLDAATYDRSGRLHSDGFRLDPRDGVVDPLYDYFHSGLNSFMLGGLRGIPDLTDKPYLITVELNEWQRIDKPGHYRLYVVSSRVGRKGGRGTFLDNGSSAVYSNVVEFDVWPPDKKWARQKLAETVSVLSQPGGNHRAACTTLRYLGTMAAVTEMRKRFRGDDNSCEWEYKFGLIGSPHRAFVIRDLENAISLREQPITSHFISTLALLELTTRAGVAPPYPNGNEEQVSKWQTEIEERQRLYEELSLHYVQQLSMAIPQKQGQARATSLQTLLDYRSQINASDFSQWATLLAFMPEVFNRLPLDDQLRLLEYQWKLIASPAMVPALREVLKYTYNNSNNNTLEDSINVFRQQKLRSYAVRRLYELSPEEGRRIILDDIRRPSPRFNEDVLSSLPDELLPELDNVLIANLEEAQRTGSDTYETSELIERYTTDAIFSRVRAVYETRDPGKWDCRTQAALLAYFLRVGPSVGSEYLNKALSSRERGLARCYTEVLKNVAALHMSPEVEDAATAALDDEDSTVVSQAASVLGEYGSANAEKALWRRLEKLHEAMQGRSQDFSDDALRDEETIEKALRNALISGQAWLMDQAKLKRLREVCLTDKSRDEIDQKINGWNYRIYIAFRSFDGEPSTIGLAHYEIKSLDSLKKRILQFPKGTIFKLKTEASRGDEPRAKEVFLHLKSYLEEHRMKLTRAE